jgi:Skp family chaperone for outer membrane proteins
MTAYDKEAPSLDSVARLAREQILRNRQEEFEATARILDSTLQQKQADLARPLMEQVAKVLDEVRAKGGYAMIFDVAGGAGVVVSADTTLDISNQVLARLKELGPPKPLPPVSAPGPILQPAGVPPKR